MSGECLTKSSCFVYIAQTVVKRSFNYMYNVTLLPWLKYFLHMKTMLFRLLLFTQKYIDIICEYRTTYMHGLASKVEYDLCLSIEIDLSCN